MSTINRIIQRIASASNKFTIANKLRLMNDIREVEKKALLMPVSNLKPNDFIAGEVGKNKPVGGNVPMFVEKVEIDSNKNHTVWGVQLDHREYGMPYNPNDKVWILRTRENELRNL